MLGYYERLKFRDCLGTMEIHNSQKYKYPLNKTDIFSWKKSSYHQLN